MHQSLVVISNSEQKFGKWSRRLITMEKIEKYVHAVEIDSGVTGHSKFREKYFNSFR
jgi:tRNA (guanine10-N2)-methyltransferase